MARPRCSSTSSTLQTLRNHPLPVAAPSRPTLHVHAQPRRRPARAAPVAAVSDAMRRSASAAFPAARNVSVVSTNRAPPSPALLGSVECGGGSVAVAMVASSTVPYKSSQAATSSPKDSRRSPGLVVTPRATISRRAQMAARRERPRCASRLRGAARAL